MNVLLAALTDALLPSSENTLSLNELLSWMLLLLPSKISTELLAPLRRWCIRLRCRRTGCSATSLSLPMMLTPHAPRSLLVPYDSITLLPLNTLERTRVARELEARCTPAVDPDEAELMRVLS